VSLPETGALGPAKALAPRCHRSQTGANRSGRNCLCTGHSWKLNGGTTQCHLVRSRRSLLQTCSIHRPLALLAKGSAAWEVAEGVAAEGVAAEGVLVYLVESRLHSSFPASSRGLPHIVHWLPTLRTSDCYRHTSLASAEAAVEAAVGVAVGVVPVWSKHHSSEHNFRASSQGLPRILQWRPNLRMPDSHRSTAAVQESVPECRNRSSHDSSPACSRGLSRILHWRPNLRMPDSHRSTSKHHSSEHSIPA